ncbi:MAG: carboxylating nicotinate-nucleotide diphosphorylase [Flavobacteriales bacterium]
MNTTEFIKAALNEDIGNGDHTSLACIPAEANQQARLLVKDQGIAAGVELARDIFHFYDKNLVFEELIHDGQPIKQGDIIFTVHGSARSILSCERLALNCMQRMSGIATLTRQMSDLLKGTHAVLLDTRKTTPLFRQIEKWAVKIAGGENHRFGLYDMIMIKDNHIDFAGGISTAVERTKTYLQEKKLNLKIEVEARNINEVNQILNCTGVHRILLDNFTPEEMKKAVDLINGKMQTEASGGITLSTIREYALTGVNYISCGALTHSAKSLDLSLKAYA